MKQVVVDQLIQGVSPRALGLSIAVGLGLGVFPVLGVTTALCVAAGVVGRLNHAVLQVANYVVYPLQLLLLIPIYRAGERLFGAAPVPLLSVAALTSRFQADPLQFLRDYALVGAYGVVVWLLVAPAAIAALYFVIRGPIELAAQRYAGRDAASPRN